jgi:hypothetical protein
MSRNLLICIGMASRKRVLKIKLPTCQCRISGSVPVLWHTRNARSKGERFDIRRGEGTVQVG